MTKKKATSSRAAARALAKQQHMPIREFLNQEPTRTKLLEGLIKKKGEGNELTLLKELLERNGPISGEHMKIDYGMHPSTVSEAAKETNEYLTEFSETSEAPELLKTEHIIICIRRKEGRGGLFIGYHFFCYNTETEEDLDGPKTRELFENLWKDFIKDRLREKLKEEAQVSLSKKLHGRNNDYQPLDMEIGVVEGESPLVRAHRTPRVYGPPYVRRPPPVHEPLWYRPPDFYEPRTYDHNRIWEPFNSEPSLESKRLYVLSSDVGTGKTTLLRHLQLESLQETDLIPIFLNASEIEGWEFKKVSPFAEKLAEDIDLRVDKNKVAAFLEEAFDRENIFLLVDGLDQIKGGADEYEPLALKIIEVMRANVIIASRPSAVTALENRHDIAFLRLRPFSRGIQKLLFGEHYERARELSVNAPDLIAIPMLAYMVRTLIEEKKDKNIKNHAELYKGFIDYILEKYRHGGAKLPLGLRNEIRVNLQKISYDSLNAKEKYIQRIPLEYYNRKLLQQKLTMKADELTKSGLVNLIIESGDCLYFTHQSFQEYLAAEWAAKSEKRIQKVLNEMSNPELKEQIKFLAGKLGEDFIRKIYSPGCKDNCIHSRLFLAAECCGELGLMCELERPTFDRLKDLVYESPFEDDAIFALSRLNDAEATDFLVSLAAGTAEYRTQYSASKILPQTKILPRHIDRLLDALESKELDGHTGNSNYSLIKTTVGTLAAFVTDAHIDRVIELEYKSKVDILTGSTNWGCLATKLSCAHIEKIFDFIARGDNSVRLTFLPVIRWLINESCWPADLQKCCWSYSGPEDLFSTPPCDISFQLCKHVDTLVKCAGSGSEAVQQEACEILAYLAGTQPLSPHQIDSISHMIKTGGEACQKAIVEKIPFLVYSDRLSLAHFNQIVESLDHASLEKRGLGWIRAYPAEHQVSAQERKKILSLLDPDCLTLKELGVCLYDDADCKLNCGEVDKIIDLLFTKRESLLRATIRTLSSHVKDVSPKQGERILNALQRINRDFGYASILKQKWNRGLSSEFCCPVPKETIMSRVKVIDGFLDSTCRFKQLLGIELLASLGDNLPKEQKAKIVALLSQGQPDIIEIVLMALPLIQRKLSVADIHRILDCIDSPDHTVREISIECLKLIKHVLLEPRVTRLVKLLENRDLEIANDALAVLAEVPHKVPKESIAKIIDMLARQETGGYKVPCYLAKFASGFGAEEIDRILGYGRTGNDLVRILAIRTLEVMYRVLPEEVFHEVITWLPSHLANSEFCHVILGMESELFAEHVDLLLELMNHREAEVQAHALRNLAGVAYRLQPGQIKQVENQLYSPTDKVRRAAYEVLKKTYALCGWPR